MIDLVRAAKFMGVRAATANRLLSTTDGEATEAQTIEALTNVYEGLNLDPAESVKVIREMVAYLENALQTGTPLTALLTSSLHHTLGVGALAASGGDDEDKPAPVEREQPAEPDLQSSAPSMPLQAPAAADKQEPAGNFTAADMVKAHKKAIQRGTPGIEPDAHREYLKAIVNEQLDIVNDRDHRLELLGTMPEGSSEEDAFLFVLSGVIAASVDLGLDVGMELCRSRGLPVPDDPPPLLQLLSS